MKPEVTLYFAYGSNLDFEDWSKWCAKKQADPSGMVEIEPAFLPDYELKFHYYSGNREGGAADVVPSSVGNLVPGVLFELNSKTLELMDDKEGVKYNCYERKWVEVIKFDGSIVKALTYVVCQEKIQNNYVEPTSKYVNLIRNGLIKRGLPIEYLDNSLGTAISTLNYIFVYGTLMKQESRNGILEQYSAEFLGQNSITGKLLHLSNFPGMIHDDNSEISGELYHCQEIGECLSKLDWIEGFYGYNSNDSLFTRIITKVNDENNPKWAWTYKYNGESGKIIKSGDWRARD
tara:strand:- start:476 stop:1345 length:870 start_codon:yes stop_codon:yes gene_type:complete